MIKEAIATAPTRDEAIEKAKAELNAPEYADVKFDVIQDAQKKVLGLFGGKDAKVRAYYEVKETESKEVVSDNKKPETVRQTVEKPVSKPVQNKKKEVPIKPEETEEPERAKRNSSERLTEEEDAKIRSYIETIVKGMGIEVTITTSEGENETVYELATQGGYGALIGRHGETLDAIQYLVRLFANKHTDSNRKVSLNTSDYREKRVESLKEVAQRSARQVLKYGRNVKLNPMNPYERRIIHTTIQEIEGVTSYSVGYDEDRRVVIALEEGVASARQGRGRSSSYGGRGRGGYNKQRGGKRSAYQPDVPKDREPKNDLEGSRYGKIDVKKTTVSPDNVEN